MKKKITITLTALSLILIMDSMKAGTAIIMFLLAGIVPGTNMSVSPTLMSLLFASLLGFTIARLLVKRQYTFGPEL